MPHVSKSPADRKPSIQGKRLDGWKVIAAYLGRGERTVKRWEARRGLPTHRIPGEGRRSVFAYAAELDEWLRSSGGRKAAQDEKGTLESAPHSQATPADNGKPAEDNSAHPGTHPGEPDGLPPEAHLFHRPHLWSYLAIYAVVLLGLTLAFLRFGNLRRHGRDMVSAAGAQYALLPPDGHVPFAPPVSSPEKAVAHELYLKGRYQWDQRTPDSLNRAVDDFTQAIVHDPDYAEAYVGLAETYALLREFSTMPDSDAFSRSLAAAKKAVQLDDSLSEAHRALAFAEMYGSLDFIDAEREFRRAIELDPRDPVVRRWYANAFGVPGRFEECLQQMDLAQSLDPASHATLADKGWMLFLAGRQEEGIRTLREVERSVPDFVSPHTYLMQIGFELRDYPMFLDEGEKMAQARNDAALQQVLAAARRGYSNGGDSGLLQAVYEEGQKHRSDGRGLSTLLAKVCIRMGRDNEALQILEDELSRHDPDVISCLSHPSLLALKDEPGYKALVKKLNFPMHAGDGSSGYLIGMNAPPNAAPAEPR